MAKPKKSPNEPSFKSLGNKGNKYLGLETFPKPEKVTRVTMTTDEVTALCPVTGQPDWYVVEVTYWPNEKCIESKSFKLFVQSLRENGMFCESLSEFILNEVTEAIQPNSAQVKVTQKPRGGVSIETVAASSPYEQ